MNPFFQISKMVKRDLTVNNIELAEKWIFENLPSESRILVDPVLLPNLMDAQTAYQSIESLKKTDSPYWVEAEKYYQSQKRMDSTLSQEHLASMSPLEFINFVCYEAAKTL